MYIKPIQKTIEIVTKPSTYMMPEIEKLSIMTLQLIKIELKIRKYRLYQSN